MFGRGARQRGFFHAQFSEPLERGLSLILEVFTHDRSDSPGSVSGYLRTIPRHVPETLARKLGGILPVQTSTGSIDLINLFQQIGYCPDCLNFHSLFAFCRSLWRGS